jgi:hypothetical protein
MRGGPGDQHETSHACDGWSAIDDELDEAQPSFTVYATHIAASGATRVAEKAATPDCFPKNYRDCPRVCCLIGCLVGRVGPPGHCPPHTKTT